MPVFPEMSVGKLRVHVRDSLPSGEHRAAHIASTMADGTPTPDTTLRALLAPRSIAVIGASRTPHTMGHQILTNLIQQGFAGAVYPVNPSAHAICSVRAYPSISDVPDTVDLAVIVVP